MRGTTVLLLVTIAAVLVGALVIPSAAATGSAHRAVIDVPACPTGENR